VLRLHALRQQIEDHVGVCTLLAVPEGGYDKDLVGSMSQGVQWDLEVKNAVTNTVGCGIERLALPTGIEHVDPEAKACLVVSLNEESLSLTDVDICVAHGQALKAQRYTRMSWGGFGCDGAGGRG
jgi:hypothetical protein